MGLEREEELLHELIFTAREYGVGSYINEKSLEGFTSFVERYNKKEKERNCMELKIGSAVIQLFSSETPRGGDQITKRRNNKVMLTFHPP